MKPIYHSVYRQVYEEHYLNFGLNFRMKDNRSKTHSGKYFLPYLQLICTRDILDVLDAESMIDGAHKNVIFRGLGVRRNYAGEMLEGWFSNEEELQDFLNTEEEVHWNGIDRWVWNINNLLD